MIHPPRIPSKNEYQRYLHESYQYIIHVIGEQQRIDEERRLLEECVGRKGQMMSDADLFANVKKIREKLKSQESMVSSN